MLVNRQLLTLVKLLGINFAQNCQLVNFLSCPTFLVYTFAL